MQVINSGKVIILSQDGTAPDRTIVKTNISDINGIFIPGQTNVQLPQSNPSMPINKQFTTDVEIIMNDGEKIRFGLENVTTPTGWNLGTNASVVTAVNTLYGWL